MVQKLLAGWPKNISTRKILSRKKHCTWPKTNFFKIRLLILCLLSRLRLLSNLLSTSSKVLFDRTTTFFGNFLFFWILFQRSWIGASKKLLTCSGDNFDLKVRTLSFLKSFLTETENFLLLPPKLQCCCLANVVSIFLLSFLSGTSSSIASTVFHKTVNYVSRWTIREETSFRFPFFLFFHFFEPK